MSRPVIQPDPSPYLTRTLRVDTARSRAQISVATAMARMLAELGLPAVRAGVEIDGFTYPADHALVYGFNIFGESLVENAQNEDEPVLVGIMPDGVVSDYRSSKPQGDSQAVCRVEVRGKNVAVAQDCAWLLHAVFSKRPRFDRQLELGGVVRTDLMVRGTRPVDEPAIAEVDVGNRVFVTFRVISMHSREV